MNKQEYFEKEIKSATADLLDELISIRRHLHAQPELSYQEHQTAAYIREFLRSLGLKYKTVDQTGTVADIHGDAGNGRMVILRADIDALPIEEQNEVPYKSAIPGVMHACGHDVHTTCLMGAAKVLCRLKGKFRGTVRLIFQHAEEKLPGGAAAMLKAGIIPPDGRVPVFAQHVFPELETGKLGFRSGKYMASSDEIYITVTGRGGHGGMPHRVIDPVVIAAQIITALQPVISRYREPFTPAVLSFGKVIAAGATNVIPEKVEMAGTLRAMDEEWRFETHQRITEIASTIAAGMGGRCHVRIVQGTPCLVNDDTLTRFARERAVEFAGAENVVELPLRMTSEDFAWYSQVTPSCFYRLGTGNPQSGITSPVHTPTFDIDESAIETGTGFMAYLALCRLMDT